MKIHEALSKIQGNLKAPKGQFNSFGKYKYRSCEDIVEAVKPLLAEVGAALVMGDKIQAIGDRVYVEATATIHMGDEQVSTSAYAREPMVKKGMDEAMITGATSSYARKYALNGLFAIDDTKDADSQDNTKTEEPSTKPQDDDKPWYNDFDQHKARMMTKITEGETPDQIIKSLSKKFKINKKIRESINELGQ